MSAALSVPVWSVTRAVSCGTATSATATAAQHSRNARTSCLAIFIDAPRRPPRYLAGAGAGAGAGALKSTFGAVDISFSLSTVKFALVL
ncbi:hypothetical protein BN961_00130 [Afipia felis]|uniref:Uncharacterized protein n=1 Tax=Afipia felis TaxID=1035 RepID=A0A090MGE9_AFIFE|nr:hypothetical protein BN961_00130 [Afipia felis]